MAASGFTSRGKCRSCRNGIAVDRENSATGEPFLGCINYPRCKNSQTIVPDKPHKRKRPNPYEVDDDLDGYDTWNDSPYEG